MALKPLPATSSSEAQDMNRALADQWRRLRRAATLVALLTSPAAFAFFHEVKSFSTLKSAVLTFLCVIAFRGIVELLLKRSIPWPSLFGTDDRRLREEDVVAHRRAWTWRTFVKWFVILVVVNTGVWIIHGGTWIHTAGWITGKLGPLFSSSQFWIQIVFVFFLFIANFGILMGPMLMMGISQIRGFEPGDAQWGVKLEDVRGQAEAKEEVRRVVNLWQSGEAFERAGGKRERGLMFLGAPGTGKTMLAKAIATGFNSPFVSIPGSGFAQTFIGIDAIIVRFLARKAKKLARKWGGTCIVFIDEIDAVGMRRSALGGGGQTFAPEVQPLTSVHDVAFYGPWGALTASGDVIKQGGEWRERVFAARAEQPVPPSGFYHRLNKIVDQAFPGGMMGGMGQLALQQLLVVMDGMDNPPFLRRIVTNRINTLMDAVFIVPVRVRRALGFLLAPVLTLGGAFMVVNQALATLGKSAPWAALTTTSRFWEIALLVVYLGLTWGGLGILQQLLAGEDSAGLRLRPPRPRKEQVYFIGATNVPLESLDPALIRPGRMGRHVWFRTPTKEDRKDVFDLYLAKVAHEEALDTPEARDELSRMTNGYSPAMIDQVCSMALTHAQHDGRMEFSRQDLVEAMTTIEAGTAIGVEHGPDRLRAIAIHEAGHAVTAFVWDSNAEATRLTIKMRGSSHGHLQLAEKEEQFGIHWRSEFMNDLTMTLGAMAAEYAFYGENGNGVGGDLQTVTALAASMVGQSGMGPESFELHGTFHDESMEQTRERIEKRFEKIGNQIMNRTAPAGGMAPSPYASVLSDPQKKANAAQIIGQAFVRAYNTVQANREGMEHITEVLLEKRELYGDEVVRLLEQSGLRKPEYDLLDERSWPVL